MFEAIPRKPSASEVCADKIRSLILENKLQPGDRLPPERELAERFGVNRMTLRAALAELRAANLIVARQGSGHVVTAFEKVAGPALLPEMVRLLEPEQQIELCADMLRIRRHVAAAAFERLAQVDHVDPAPIRAAISRFYELAEAQATTSELALADVEIVGAVLEATGSIVFRLVVNPIAQALEALPALRDALYFRPELTGAVHSELVNWLDQRTEAGIARLFEALTARDQFTVAALREQLTGGP